MKRLIRYTALLLVAVMLMTTPAFAAERAINASNYIMCTSVYLHPTGGTTFQVWFEISALGLMDSLGAYTIKVQRSSDNVNWTTMRTYYPEDYTQMIDVDTILHAGCVEYTGTAGYYYRAYVCMFAQNSKGRGEFCDYTDPIRL